MVSKDEDAQLAKAEGRYANFFEVGHNAVEFVLVFGQSYSESEPPTVHTTIVTTPMYAKRLLAVLEEAVARFEVAYGPVLDDSGEHGKRTQ